jgi:hypothetical protein
MHELRQTAADHVPCATKGDSPDGAKLDHEATGVDAFWQAWHIIVAILSYIGDSIPNLGQVVKLARPDSGLFGHATVPLWDTRSAPPDGAAVHHRPRHRLIHTPAPTGAQ